MVTFLGLGYYWFFECDERRPTHVEKYCFCEFRTRLTVSLDSVNKMVKSGSLFCDRKKDPHSFPDPDRDKE